MANIVDYLAWRGDLTWSRSPFNDVDNLLLCTLTYTDFEKVIPGLASSETIALSEAAKRYFEIYTQEEIRTRSGFTSQVPLMIFQQMADSARFRRVRLGGFFNMIDDKSEVQISAVTYHLGDCSLFVSYRGTDNSLAGWKEDFNMSFTDATPGQQMAVSYLNHVMRQFDGPVRIGGHSKGGNFAIYAAAFCEEQFKDRIVRIWNNDGPGFSKEVASSPELASVWEKITNFVPEGSIFGLLLNNPVPRKVILSGRSGIYQHDTLSWQVLGTGLVEAPGLSEASQYFERIVKDWIDRLSPHERREFVDTIFNLAGSGENKKISDIDTSLKGYGEILKAIAALPKERQHVLKTTLTALVKSGAENLSQPLTGKVGTWIGKAEKAAERLGILEIKE